MLIGMTGASGFLGRPLARRLTDAGHTVVPISREPGLLPGVDALIHLGGESIAGRWTRRKRRAILESRIEGTRRLVDRMAAMDRRPEVFLCASGTGIYGDRPGETLTEESPAGEGFRSEVCVGWEGEARRAESLGIRTVRLRFGAILGPSGGYLGKLVPWFERGFGFVLGEAEAPLAWVGLEDAVRFVEFALERPVAGAVNVAAPEEVTQGEFARLLAASLGRRLAGRLPNWVLRLGWGEMSRALTDRQRVVPAKALGLGFPFLQDFLASCNKG